MRIYYNLDGQTEVISDGYKLQNMFEDTAFRIQSKMIVEGDVNVDVGCGNAFGGKNQDQQQGAAGGPPVQKVNNIVSAFSYGQYYGDLAAWKTYYKDYMKQITPKIKPERLDAFKKGCTQFGKWVIKNFNDLTIYTPKCGSQDGALIYAHYEKQEDEAPYMYFLVQGLKSQKV